MRSLEPAGPGESMPPLLATLRVWLVAILALIAVGIAHTLTASRLDGLAELYFYGQDLTATAVYLFLLGALCLLPPWGWTLSPPAAGWRTVLLIAAAVTAFAWAGAFLICDDFAQTMDEYMPRFDAQILASGRLSAPVPLQWREFVPALQPIFLLDVPGHAAWVSGYLPVNAAFLALASKLGAQSLMPPLWAGISVIATYAVGRRLWPDRPMAALAAAVLLATSPQFLVHGMTTFAMSALLALNMVWLWLLLRGGRLGHGAAAGVAFLATGLHQIVFHPLFAAPFVLELWLAKRWKPALWHSCAYAGIGLFWAIYPALVLRGIGAAPIAAAAQSHGAFAMLPALLAGFDPMGSGLVAKHLVRFFTWQSLLTLPLALTAIVPAVRAGGMPRALVLGMVFTLAAMVVLMPMQGHGYGYRYLHGLMGSLCLLAGWRWTTLTPGSAGTKTASPALPFMAAIGLTLTILLPLRLSHARDSEHPYALAERQIQAMDADVVLVEPRGVYFGFDLVRNDPFLRNRPLVLDRSKLTNDQLAKLCRYAVRTFRPAQAWAAGVPRAAELPREEGELKCSS